MPEEALTDLEALSPGASDVAYRCPMRRPLRHSEVLARCAGVGAAGRITPPRPDYFSTPIPRNAPGNPIAAIHRKNAAHDAVPIFPIQPGLSSLGSRMWLTARV